MPKKPSYEELEQAVAALRCRNAELEREKEDCRKLLENLNEVVYCLDPQTRITYISANIERIAGYTADEVIGRPFKDFLHPDDLLKRLESYENVLKGAEYSHEYRYLTKNRGYVWGYTRHKPIFDGGEVVAVQGVLVDITEQKKVEEALRESQERFDFAMQASKDGIWDWDLTSDTVYYSPAYYEMLGYTSDEVIPTSGFWKDLIHPEDREPAVEANMKCISNRVDHFAVEFRMQAKSKKWLWILSRGKVVSRDPEGRALRMVGTHTDITALKQASKRLKESREQYRTLAEEAPVSIMHFDKQGTVKFVNKWHARVFAKGKLDKDYFLNRKITELPGIQSAGIETELEKILHGETVFLPMVHIPRFAAGHEGYQCIRGVPIFWKDEVQGGILIREDITEQKRTEEEKTRLDHQLKEAQKLEALGRMAGAVAHHFNNQLSIVMGRLELSLEIIEDIWIRRHVDEAIHASHRAAHISRQMLAYLGKKDTKKARLDLSELCRQHLKIINSGIAEGINLVADLQAIGPVVYCNAHDLKEALTALVTNACEAIEDFFGQVILRTGTIEASQINRYELFPAGWGPSENDYACLEVSDTGSGIEEENIIKIFDPFFSTKFVGRGLGLPVVLGMARGNGGGVGVQSKPGSGTKISLFLPLESITSG